LLVGILDEVQCEQHGVPSVPRFSHTKYQRCYAKWYAVPLPSVPQLFYWKQVTL